jgi:hypothetical protein
MGVGDRVPISWTVPVPRHPRDFEFSSGALSERIVRAALERDAVRVERAIAAALEIHGDAGRAERWVFAQARLAAARVGPACAAAVAEAIDAHVYMRRAA